MTILLFSLKLLPNLIHFFAQSGIVPSKLCSKSQPSILQFVYLNLLTQQILC